MAEGFSGHAAYGVFFVDWGIFSLPFACWVGCHVLQSAVRIGCLWYHGRARRWDCAPCKGGDITSACVPNLLQQNGLSAFPPGTCWASSPHLHIVFPKAGLVQGCSLEPDPGTQCESRGQRMVLGMRLTALVSPHPVEQTQRQRPLC